MDDPNAPATKNDLQGAVQQLRSEMQHQYDDLKETLRDSETKLLQAFYSFAESKVEKRLNMPPAA
jgi:hypothetical protein